LSSEENFSDELRESAELRIKRALIIEELSKFHKLEINDKDVEKELQEWKKQKNNSNFSDDQILDLSDLLFPEVKTWRTETVQQAVIDFGYAFF